MHFFVVLSPVSQVVCLSLSRSQHTVHTQFMADDNEKPVDFASGPWHDQFLEVLDCVRGKDVRSCSCVCHEWMRWCKAWKVRMAATFLQQWLFNPLKSVEVPTTFLFMAYLSEEHEDYMHRIAQRTDELRMCALCLRLLTSAPAEAHYADLVGECYQNLMLPSVKGGLAWEPIDYAAFNRDGEMGSLRLRYIMALRDAVESAVIALGAMGGAAALYAPTLARSGLLRRDREFSHETIMMALIAMGPAGAEALNKELIREAHKKLGHSMRSLDIL